MTQKLYVYVGGDVILMVKRYDRDGDGVVESESETNWQSTEPSLRTVPKSTWSFTSISSFEPITCKKN